MADAAYESAVKNTFETKPLRTVLMIDDEFPTFADLARGETEETSKRFVQKERAVALYEAFQKSHMICDVENVVAGVQTDRLRKSDLIILDYHLGPSEGETETAIRILRDLSSSKHFNTVVVYTSESDQNKVWLDIIASLSGGWAVYPASLEGEAQQHWETLSDDGKLPTAPLGALMEFAKRGNTRDLSSDVRETMEAELLALEVPRPACNEIIKAMIHVEMSRRASPYHLEPHRPAVGDYAEGRRWIQSGNAFITILQKSELSPDESDPAGIMSCLREALLAWRPNLVQILISEIQNILELEALATEDDHLRDPVTQTALWYYLLSSLGPINPNTEHDVKVPLMSVIDKIVDGIRRRLSSDQDLLALASQALLGELRHIGWTAENWPEPGRSGLIKASAKIARTEGLTKGDGQDTLFRLNSFFSTEKFRREHLTTGTVFYHPTNKEYFVATSPACDLVARKPGKNQAWMHAIHPLVPFVAILLHTDNISRALEKAEQALHLFLEISSEKKVFKIVNEVGQPSFEFFFARNEGRVREDNGRTVFDAARLIPKNAQAADGIEQSQNSPLEHELSFDVFEIVDQLRGMNATRILQMAGQHLSRIGLDYFKLPS